MVVNDVNIEVMSRANQHAVTANRKHTRSLSDWNGLDAK